MLNAILFKTCLSISQTGQDGFLYVEKAETLVRWLVQDVSGGRTISFGTTPWKPNERIVGMLHAKADDSIRFEPAGN